MSETFPLLGFWGSFAFGFFAFTGGVSLIIGIIALAFYFRIPTPTMAGALPGMVLGFATVIVLAALFFHYYMKILP